MEYLAEMCVGNFVSDVAGRKADGCSRTTNAFVLSLFLVTPIRTGVLCLFHLLRDVLGRESSADFRVLDRL
ncbi:hypothetical protein NDU88_004973 [Pleurodeles waltl]|uniref:Uncharacterized protein n=1 Tax=Pleurodeles waltl TaxID=8319 RepID=A0AAV7TV93_PLEWA|nr:hypothetical protein NDU88_004973 [Pleurodeles waltl]